MNRTIKSLIIATFASFMLAIPAFADNLTMGINALKKNDLSSALQYFSLSITENRSDPLRLYYLGLTLKNMGEKARAQRAFKTALKLNPSSSLKNKLYTELRKLSYGKPTVKTGISQKVLKIQQKTKLPNYLSNVVGDQIFRWDL